MLGLKNKKESGLPRPVRRSFIVTYEAVTVQEQICGMAMGMDSGCGGGGPGGGEGEEGGIAGW